MSVQRRGFLRLLAAAPVAVPVAAREAAAKAGIGSLGSAALSLSPTDGSESLMSHRDWIAEKATRVLSKAWEQEERSRAKEWNPTSLDPDLACSRSMSLCTAMRIQRQRNVEAYIAKQRESAKRDYLRVFGLEFVG